MGVRTASSVSHVLPGHKREIQAPVSNVSCREPHVPLWDVDDRVVQRVDDHAYPNTSP